MLYIGALAAGVFAAWQANEWWMNRSAAGPQTPPTAEAVWAATEPADDAAGDPMGLLRQQSGQLKWQPLAGDPGGVPAVPLAMRRYCGQQLSAGYICQQARYICPCAAGAVADHYRSVLARAGYQALVQTQSQGWQDLTFVKGSVKVTLRVRGLASQAEAVIVVTWPADSNGPASKG